MLIKNLLTRGVIKKVSGMCCCFLNVRQQIPVWCGGMAVVIARLAGVRAMKGC